MISSQRYMLNQHFKEDLPNLEFKNQYEFMQAIKVNTTFFEVNIGGVQQPYVATSDVYYYFDKSGVLNGSRRFNHQTQHTENDLLIRDSASFVGDIQNAPWKAVFTSYSRARNFYERLSHRAIAAREYHLSDMSLLNDMYDDFDIF